jgi:hypothetical protein
MLNDLTLTFSIDNNSNTFVHHIKEEMGCLCD